MEADGALAGPLVNPAWGNAARVAADSVGASRSVSGTGGELGLDRRPSATPGTATEGLEPVRLYGRGDPGGRRRGCGRSPRGRVENRGGVGAAQRGFVELGRRADPLDRGRCREVCRTRSAPGEPLRGRDFGSTELRSRSEGGGMENRAASGRSVGGLRRIDGGYPRVRAAHMPLTECPARQPENASG